MAARRVASSSGVSSDDTLGSASSVSARRGGGSGGGRLPLAPDFFQKPQLSGKETKYLLGLAKHACKEVVYYSRREDGPMRWLQLSSEDGVDVFQGVDESAALASDNARPLTYLRGSCRIQASLDEVADFFKLDTAEKCAGFAQSVGKDLLDQQTLLELAGPTAENPRHYVGVKWTAVESPSKLARNRDFCYIECHDEFIDTSSKQRGWVRSIHSIRLPFCPSLSKSHGLVRGSFYRSGFIFVESATQTNCVDAVHTLHLDIKGNAPNWLKILTMKRRIKNIAQLNQYFRRRRLAQGKLLGDLELPAADGVARCQRCSSRFGLFHRKWRCRKCGKVICSHCGHDFLLDYGGMGPKKVRICLECSDDVALGAVSATAESANGSGNASHANTNTEPTVAASAKVRRVPGSDVRPLYDESPSSSQAQSLDGRQFSIEEQEYYMEHEDATGMADMLEAKRMHREFEELLTSSGHGHFRVAQDEDKTQARRRDPNAKSTMTSASGETLPAESPPELPRWEEQHDAMRQVANDCTDDFADDSELGLPPSKQEQQQRQQRQLEEMRRQEQLQRVQQHATSTAHQLQPSGRWPASQTQQDFTGRSRQRVDRSESGDSLRLSTEWGEEYFVGSAGRVTAAMVSSFRSAGSARSSGGSGGKNGRVSRSDLSVDSRPSLSREQSTGSASARRDRASSVGTDALPSENRERRYANGVGRGLPRGRVGIPRSVSRDSGEDGRSMEMDPERQRQTQSYFDKRNARLAQLQSESSRRRHRYDSHSSHSQSSEQDHGDADSIERVFNYERDAHFTPYRHGVGGSSGSDPPLMRRRLPLSELESPYQSVSDDFTSHRRLRNRDEDFANADDEAFRMAMDAMRLYEQERGPGLRVTEETRRAALSKMMNVYAREIERSHSSDAVSIGRVGNGSLHVHEQRQNELEPPQLRRALSEDQHSSLYGRSPREFQEDQLHEAPRSQEGRAPGFMRNPPRGGELDAHEYRDLSDLSSSAFRAFQRSSQGPNGMQIAHQKHHQQPRDPSEATNGSINNSYQPDDGMSQTASAQAPRESTSTATHKRQNSKSDTTSFSEGRSAMARATYGSVASSDLVNLASRPGSMHDIADSDTFSDMDLIDLPHLMRKDDPRRGSQMEMETAGHHSAESSARNSFADLQRWEEEVAAATMQSLTTPEDSETTHESPVTDAVYIAGVQRRMSDLMPGFPDTNSSSSDLQSPAPRPDDDDSDASSNTSSQIDWASSLVRSSVDTDTNGEVRSVPMPASVSSEPRYAGEYSSSHHDQAASFSDLTSALYADDADYRTSSGNMLAHDNSQRPHSQSQSQLSVQELRRYRKSLTELLSEYSGSERSSLPSFGDLTLPQPELEPEYLQAINASGVTGARVAAKISDDEERPRQHSAPTGGYVQLRDRRARSTETQLTGSRELFL